MRGWSENHPGSSGTQGLGSAGFADIEPSLPSLSPPLLPPGTPGLSPLSAPSIGEGEKRK